jgi:hypothetical protein
MQLKTILIAAAVVSAVTTALYIVDAKACWSDDPVGAIVATFVHGQYLSRSSSATPAVQIRYRTACAGNVMLVVHGVTEASIMGEIEQYARESLRSIVGVKGITIRFFEKEIWIERPDGSGHRGKERLINEVRVSSENG